MTKCETRSIERPSYEVWVSTNGTTWWKATGGPHAHMTKAQADGLARKGFMIRYYIVRKTLVRRMRGVIKNRKLAIRQETAQGVRHAKS